MAAYQIHLKKQLLWVMLLATCELVSCLPIITQPYSYPLTDGLLLGEPQLRSSSGIDETELAGILRDVLQDGFIPLLFSGNSQSELKLKYLIGQSVAQQVSYVEPLYFPTINEITGDEVQMSISLPANRLTASPTAPETQISALASFNNTSWNRSKDHSHDWSNQVWQNPQRVITLDWQLSGTQDGKPWQAELQQPALRATMPHWAFGYGWLVSEPPGHWQYAWSIGRE